MRGPWLHAMTLLIAMPGGRRLLNLALFHVQLALVESSQ